MRKKDKTPLDTQKKTKIVQKKTKLSKTKIENLSTEKKEVIIKNTLATEKKEATIENNFEKILKQIILEEFSDENQMAIDSNQNDLNYITQSIQTMNLQNCSQLAMRRNKIIPSIEISKSINAFSNQNLSGPSDFSEKLLMPDSEIGFNDKFCSVQSSVKSDNNSSVLLYKASEIGVKKNQSYVR